MQNKKKMKPKICKLRMTQIKASLFSYNFRSHNRQKPSLNYFRFTLVFSFPVKKFSKLTNEKMSGRYAWYAARQQGRQFQQLFDQPQQQWVPQNGGGWMGVGVGLYPNTPTQVSPTATPSPTPPPFVPEYPTSSVSTAYVDPGYGGPVSEGPAFYTTPSWFPESYGTGYGGYSAPQQQFNPPFYQQSLSQYTLPGLQYEPQQQFLPQQQEWGVAAQVEAEESRNKADSDMTATSHFNRWLTKRITETSTPKELLHLIQSKIQYFDKVHLAAGYVQAARFQQDKGSKADNHCIQEAVELLCLRSTPEMLALMDGWTLSNSMWGLVKTKYHTSTLGKSVSKFLIAEVARKADTFKSQELSITAWSLARMKMRSESVLNEISRVALQRTETLGPQAISNTLWAFASLNQYDANLFNALVKATANSFEEFDPQGLSNVLWALAQMGHYDEEFMQQVCDFLCGVEDHSFKIFPVGLSQIIVALGRLNFSHERLLDRIISKVVQDFSRIDQQSLCNTFFYWALLKQDYEKVQSLAQEIVNRYEQGGVHAFKSADLQRICEGVQLFEVQGLQVDFPEALMVQARRELLGSYGEVTVPQKVKVMIQEIVDILTEMGESPTPYQLLQNPIYEVPIGVEIGGKLLAIFAVGTRMYSSTQPHRKSGLMIAKQSLLQYFGWNIVDTPIHEWNTLNTKQEQQDYLKRKLNAALGTNKYRVSATQELPN
eukprot:TRINITY_DN3911_c0_g1_i1.p2 TRINITY_DN3911_c0_g1~~TRINITY_DN3911_c0_g1_i1.p2  ORF type:complete len:715 (-),score=106.40 TRINITY_DN3911_c0_g1_i1:5615-7759(-)